MFKIIVHSGTNIELKVSVLTVSVTFTLTTKDLDQLAHEVSKSTGKLFV